MTRTRQSGMSLMEVLAALAIVSVMIVGTMTVVANAHHLTRLNTNKEFATQKAISMLEELKSLVQSTTSSSIIVLDAYDDGITDNALLTTQNALATPPTVLPSDAISGNTPMGPGKWLFERRISVQKLPGQSNDVRLVNVKVFQNTLTGAVLMAEVAGVLRTVVSNMPPTQVYDVYALSIENIPGWWVYMSNVVPFVRSAISDLQSRNPGLVFRSHFITALAYGRDQQYTPYIINAATSIANVPYAYFYPGKMPMASPLCTCAQCCGDDYYYPAFFFKGHMNIDGPPDTNGYNATNNPQPYALADQFNHAARYVDEKAIYDARKAANPGEEMTWRLLLDDMYMNPQKYSNALLINLHGELLPFPPVRNYSDAAKNPEQTFAPDLRNIRAVTHAEQLRYTNADKVNLRVYTYLADPAAAASILPVPLTIRISGTNSWNPANGAVTFIHGGVDNDGSGAPDPYDAAPVTLATACPVPGKPNQMCWTSSLSGSDTVLKLYNSPLKAPIETSGRGLAAENRLYGLDYIPSPVENLTTAAVQFSTDLTSTAVLPKNTARWIISVPVAAFFNDSTITVETRIGDQVTSGVLYPPAAANQPANLSRTYVWRGTDKYIFGDTTVAPVIPPALPLTERYQFQGDPRHCPYADLKRPHLSNTFPSVAPIGAYESSLGMGYNRYFDNLEDGTRNRGAWTEWVGSKVEPFNIISAVGPTQNNRFALKINGGVAFSVTLINGGARTAAQIAAELNANGTFNANAIADAVSGRVRITAINPGATVQFDKTIAARIACANTLGFDDAIHTEIAWPGWSYTVAGQQYGVKNDGAQGPGTPGWSTLGGNLEIDVHRLFQMVRSALIRSNAIWTTMTGFSYYYVGIGNEIGYDAANNFTNSIPVSTLPFTGVPGSQYENSITGSVKYIRENNGASSWWAMPWVGELYPDSMYPTWKAVGNIPTGVGANTFVRDRRSNFPSFPGTNLTDAVRRTHERGSTTLFWTGGPNSTFHHASRDGDTAAIQPSGQDIADNYSLPVPAIIDNARPFDINVDNTSMNPDSFLQPGAYPAACTSKVLNQYFQHNGGAPIQASALIALSDPVTRDPSFIAVNGLSPSGVSGTTFIAKWSFLSLIQSFLNGGLYTDASASPKAKHVRQVPRVVITQPNDTISLKDPPSVTIAWDTTWKRWDAQQYTANAAYAAWIETLTLQYEVIYSPSNGVPNPSGGNPTGWFYVSDGSVATPGIYPDALNTTTPAVVSATAHQISQVISAATTTNSLTWSTPSASFPQGNYLLRVEAYRNGLPLHYAFHQYRAFIQR